MQSCDLLQSSGKINVSEDPGETRLAARLSVKSRTLCSWAVTMSVSQECNQGHMSVALIGVFIAYVCACVRVFMGVCVYRKGALMWAV